MKLKKLKKLLWAVNEIAKRDIKEIKGLKPTGLEASPGHPLILLPTQGKYCLPEVQVINKIMKSIEPAELVHEARKINLQAGILLVSVLKHPVMQNKMLLLVHSPYGCCAYNVEINQEYDKPDATAILHPETVDPGLLKDNFEIM